MAIDAITIGPFKGGLNNVAQSGESTDTEVVDLVNMGVTTDGALTSRPPFRWIDGFNSTLAPYEILGVYRESSTRWYLIIQERNNFDGWTIKVYENANIVDAETIRTTMKPSEKFTAFVQVGEFGYFLADTYADTISCFKWKPRSAYADISGMPKGKLMVSYKSRLWVTGTDAASTNSRIWFSTIDTAGIKLDTWNQAVDYFDVAPGEGGYITAVVALNSSMVVFKNDSAYRWSFGTTPAKGVVDRISTSVGAANKNVVVEFNNLVYTYDQGKLYELVNNSFSAINRRIEFVADPEVKVEAEGTDLSVVGTNLVLRYFNALYIYSGETGTWSQWRSEKGIPGKFTALPSDSNSSKPTVYWAPTVPRRISGQVTRFYMIQADGDYSSLLPVENIECVMRTKAFDYKNSSTFKRLFWWGIDHKSSMTFTAKAIPIVKRRLPTWKEAASYTWGDLAAATWGNPLKGTEFSTVVSDDFDVSNEQTDNGRIFSKIKKSLRFRQISYEIRMKTRGDVSTGPVKIFSLTTYVTGKHNVVDKNN